MFNLLTKFIFYLKKPKVIIVAGKGRASASEAIFQVLKKYFKVKKVFEKIPGIFSLKNNFFIIETDFTNSTFIKKINFLIKSSRLPILITTHLGEIPFSSDLSADGKSEADEIQKFVKNMPPFGCLVINSDDGATRKIGDMANLRTLSFGFREEADFRASDIKVNGDTNFKINYKGKIIPVWLDGSYKEEQIYGVFAAIATGTIVGLNFIEIAEALKNYKLPSNKIKI